MTTIFIRLFPMEYVKLYRNLPARGKREFGLAAPLFDFPSAIWDNSMLFGEASPRRTACEFETQQNGQRI